MTKYPWQGIQFQIHPLFWGIIVLSVWTGHFVEITTLFVLVMLHEMGHVTAAWSYGWTIRKIELLPFGGVAVIDEWGNARAKEEIVVSLAGPFQHIWMILLSYVFYVTGWWSQEWTLYFMKSNLVIAAFNMLPIYPLDGGRILQSMLSYWLPYRRCINLMYCISLFFAVTLMILSFVIPGITVHPSLLIIGLFLVYTNWIALKKQEYQFLRFLLHRLDGGVSGTVPLYKMCVVKNVPLPIVIRKWYRERHHVLEVVDQQGKVMGFITEESVLRSYFDGKWCEIKDLLQ